MMVLYTLWHVKSLWATDIIMLSSLRSIELLSVASPLPVWIIVRLPTCLPDCAASRVRPRNRDAPHGMKRAEEDPLGAYVRRHT